MSPAGDVNGDSSSPSPKNYAAVPLSPSKNRTNRPVSLNSHITSTAISSTGALASNTALVTEALTPAPSVSRTGKMAESAMSTKTLVRAGIAAFSPPKRSGRGGGVSVVEVVDPAQLDSFGTEQPRVDAGRNRELCSSPREHPLLQAKLEAILETEKLTAFDKSLQTTVGVRGGKDGNRPNDNTEDKKPNVVPLSPWELMREVGDSETIVPPAHRRPNLGSPCFRTSERFKVRPPEAPPVGHYRPKHAIVEKRNNDTVLRGRPSTAAAPPGVWISPDLALSWNISFLGGSDDVVAPSQVNLGKISENKFSHTVNSQGTTGGDHSQSGNSRSLKSPLAPSDRPFLGSASSKRGDDFGATDTGNMDGRDQLLASAGNATTPGTAPSKFAPTADDTKRSSHRGGRGTSVFISKTHGAGNNAASPLRSPDRFYDCYNDEAVSTNPRSGKGCFVEFSKQAGHGDLWTYSDAPDVIYDVQHNPNAKCCVEFDKQVSGTKAANHMSVMIGRRGHALLPGMDLSTVNPYPADSHMYSTTHTHHMDKTSKYPKPPGSPSFSKTTSRDQAPTIIQKPVKATELEQDFMQTEPTKKHDPKHPNTTTKQTGDWIHNSLVSRQNKGTVTFDKQSGRPLFLNQVPLNVQYDVNEESVKPKQKVADFSSSPQRGELFRKGLTSHLDYQPNYAAVNMRIEASQLEFEKNMSRPDTTVRVLDKFYDSSSSLTGKRLTGDPLMNLHMTRERRHELSAEKRFGADKFYDVNLSASLPAQTYCGVDFKKSISREESSGGRFHPPSQKSESKHPRSPGAVYDPKPVYKRSPGLGFSTTPRAICQPL